MAQTMPFGEVLEVIDQLSLDEQETLVDILHRRMAERGRQQLVAEIEAARQEFAEGGCQPATTDDLMKEILS
jgi:hypothetical protein